MSAPYDFTLAELQAESRRIIARREHTQKQLRALASLAPYPAADSPRSTFVAASLVALPVLPPAGGATDLLRDLDLDYAREAHVTGMDCPDDPD